MSHTNWRDPTDYEVLRTADVATLAGEFLKRNPDYQADRERLVRLSGQRMLTVAERDTFALAWGSRFRGGQRSSDLDIAGVADRRRGDRDTGLTGRTMAPR